MKTNNVMTTIAIFMAFVAGMFCTRLEDEQTKTAALEDQLAAMQLVKNSIEPIEFDGEFDLVVDSVTFTRFEQMPDIDLEPKLQFADTSVGDEKEKTEEKSDTNDDTREKESSAYPPVPSTKKVVAKADTSEPEILYTIPEYDSETYDRPPFVLSAKKVFDILEQGKVNYVGNVAPEMIPVKSAIHRRFEMIPKNKLLGHLRYVAMTTREVLHWSDASHYSPVGPKVFRDGEVMLDLNTRGDKQRGVEGSAYGPSQFVDVSRKVVFNQDERLPYSAEDLEIIQSTKILGRHFHGDIELGYKAWEIYMYLTTTGEHFENKARKNGFDPFDDSVRIACWNGGVRGFFELGYARSYRKAFKTNFAMLSERWKISPQSELIAKNN